MTIRNAYGKNAFQAFLIFFTIMVTIHGCGGESGHQDDDTDDVTAHTAELRIGPQGGTLEVTDGESPLFGTRISVPEGALDNEKDIYLDLSQLGDNDLPGNYLQASQAVDFGPDGTVFNLPVEVTLPYSDADDDGRIDATYVSEDGVRVLFYNTTTNAWEELATARVDTAANLITVSVNHFTLFLVAVDPLPDDTTPATTEILQDEYFVGEPQYSSGEFVKLGCLNGRGGWCWTPYYLTVRYFGDTTPEAVIDRWPTTNTGPRVTITDDGTGVIFDASRFFEKVLRSGSAASWQWESEFDTHTHLVNYDRLDDTIATADNKIYSEISVLDDGSVSISWGFDLASDFLVGDQIVIAFEAYYK